MLRYFISFMAVVLLLTSCDGIRNDQPYKDHSHFSHVFGHEKFFRIYLPNGYKKSEVQFPVIYFFHGWGGRHFKDDNAKLDYERIHELVEKNQVILVMWDGNIEEAERRPYNIGNHEDVKYQVQMKDYFPELMDHIDSIYRTKTDRSNRAIIGYSMGGITSYFMAGKYPHLVCASVNLTGSPEFFMGTPENHTLYSLRHTFGNLHGVKLRQHNSTVGELAYLNREVEAGAVREKGLDYVYEEYEGGHKVDLPGEIKVFKEAFDFVVAAFEDPLPAPEKWHHVDLYPEFHVWGYHVKSNLDEPGYIELKNVTKSAMEISTKKWLPDGPRIPGVEIQVMTAPIYNPHSEYQVFEYSADQNRSIDKTVQSDEQGRISFTVNHESHEIGIFSPGDPADPVLVSYRKDEKGLFLNGQDSEKMYLTFLNKGGSNAENLRIKMTTDHEGIHVLNSTIEGVTIQKGETALIHEPFVIESDIEPPVDGSPWHIRFNLEITDDQNQSWEDDFDVPVFYNVPQFKTIHIDDGKAIGEDDLVQGSGNGDGIPDAGETIMVYTRNNRTRLYCDDPYIEASKEVLFDEVLPSKWPDGFTLSSIIKISDDCPHGHWVRLLANYETKEFMPVKRTVHWGTVLLQVRNN